MVLTLKKDTDKKQLDTLTAWLNSQNIKVHISKGESVTIVGLVGDTSRLDTDLIQGLSMVENVTRITEPYKNAKQEEKVESKEETRKNENKLEKML